jgi:hypothetical protein
LENELAVLPPTADDVARYHATLADPRNRARNLVAVLDTRIIGTVTYRRSDDG